MPYIIHTIDGELYHHGVLGQKWGVRRYQNEDGTRTALGRQHEGYSQYGNANGHITTRRQYKKALEEHSSARGREISDKYNPEYDAVAKDKTLSREEQQRRNEDITNRMMPEVNALVDEMHGIDAKYKSDRAAAKSDWASDRNAIRKSRSLGRKVGTFLIQGPFGITTYNRARASGYDALTSTAINYVSGMLGGPIGNVAVNMILKEDYIAKHSDI